MLRFDLTFRTRLVALLGTLSLMLIGVGGLGIYGMHHSNQGLLDVYQHRTLPIGDISEVRDLLMRSYLVTMSAVNDPSPPKVDQAVARATEHIERARALWASYASREMTEKEQTLADRLVEHRDAYLRSGLTPTLDALQAGRIEDAYALAHDVMRSGFDRMLPDVEALIAYELEEARHKYEQEQSLFGAIRNITVITVIGVALLACLLGYLIIRAIVVPLGEAVQVANDIASGDLSRDIDVRHSGEAGMLMSAMQRMVQGLRRLVTEIMGSSTTVHSEASQIAAASMSLSQRTEEQASSLEETAASMEQMTSTVRQSADNAARANQFGASARESAEKGGQVVTSAVRAINEIRESSARVSEIITVIDEIAFQTNLLALNAAVEAARAGEQGRGFAVVASEVRALAQRAADSARDIKELIEDSVGKVSQGAELVEHSGATLAEIIDKVNQVTHIVAEIAAASEEQAVGIEQVNRAVAQLDQVTQQNAAMVEETTASSQSQAELARNLQELVSQYRVQADAGVAAREAERLPAKRADADIVPLRRAAGRGEPSAPPA